MQAIGPNADQIGYWNETAGPKWADLADTIDAHLEPLGADALDALGPAEGERVLDVGCGCGRTTLQIAARVGAAGSVLGVDISGPMLERARQRAADAAAHNVHFERGDAQTHAFGVDVLDAVFSRLGVMFFAQPEEAFANLARALRPDGRLVFVCWQALERNPWMHRPLAAVAPLVSPAPPADPHAPGPLALADPERVRGILERAGLGDVRIEGLERELLIGGGGGLDAAVRFLLQVGPAARALREAPPSLHEQAAKAVAEALAPFAGADGVRLPAAAWLVSARAGG